MNKACCGFDCNKCPLFIASKHNDEDMRQEVVKMYEISDMKCLGCLSDKPCSACIKCAIRTCCLGKGYENCGQCESYPNCKIIMPVYNTNPASREVMDKAHIEKFGE